MGNSCIYSCGHYRGANKYLVRCRGKRERGKKKIKEDRKGIRQRVFAHWKLHPWRGFIGAVILAILAAVLVTPFYETIKDYLHKPIITITEINDNTIKDCGTKGNPCRVFLEGNTVSGIVSKNNFQIYIIVHDISRDQYIIQGRPGNALHTLETGFLGVGKEEGWEGEFSLGGDIGSRFTVSVILTGEPLTKGSVQNNLPSHITRSKAILATPTKTGSFKENRSTRRLARISPPLRTVPSRLYADIYLGRVNYKQSKTSARTVTANLFYNGFENKVERAEIDWGEGRGWEGIELHRQGEYYQVRHTFQTIGRKDVKYRVTDEMGESVEVKDTIEVIKSLELKIK